jgi:hypothetical protein
MTDNNNEIYWLSVLETPPPATHLKLNFPLRESSAFWNSGQPVYI